MVDCPTTICMGNSCSPGRAGDVFDGIFLCCPFSHEMFWIRSGINCVSVWGFFLPTLPSEAVVRVWT